jgi:hypothetical protein
MNKLSDSECIATFLSYLSSKQLVKQWHKIKYNYEKQTIMLVELLIKSINENEFNNPDDVINFSNKFIFTNDFKKILNYKDNHIMTLE